MKIGLMTIHAANSYGGMLQAYASKQVLSAYGNVRIIDYKTEHLRKTMSLVRWNDGPRSPLRAAKDLFRLFPRRRLLQQFERFGADHLGPLASLDDEFDVAVAGSDQIWNPAVTASLDPTYFLRSVRTSRKVSFSSSMGSHRYSPDHAIAVRSMLSAFSDISVREPDTAHYLSGMLAGRHIATTVDPTLMLRADDWRRIATESKLGEYLLVYSLKDNGLLKSVVATASGKLGLPVVAINQNPFASYRVDTHVKDAGPLEFLSLFAGARFVVTNSFHGTAFAVNLGVPFVTTEPESGRNRIANLLNDVCLPDRLVSSASQVDGLLNVAVATQQVGDALEARRQGTRRYLDRALRA
jgi:hypothetical protein